MSDMPGISSEERERRWSNIRHAIRRSGLDALIVVSDGHMERRGSMRYVSNVNTPFMYGYVVFPLEGEPIAVNVRGEWIKEIRILPVRGGWVPESEPYAVTVADVIKELNIEKGRIGVEGDFIAAFVYQRLVKELPRATFVPSNIIHELKCIKSPEELRFIQKGVEMVDRAFETCLEVAGRGKTWNEISSQVCQTLYRWGMENIGGFPLPRSNDFIRAGDSYLLFPETQAFGGYWIQFGRLLSFGEPEKELREAWKLSLEAQARAAEKLRPGQTGADVMRAINDALERTKYIGALRGSGHGIGLDVLEKPFLSLDDETVLQPGMVIAIHPLFSPPAPLPVLVADMFVVTENEPRKLSRIPAGIKVA